MRTRLLFGLGLALSVAACGISPPPDPRVDFARASTLPLSASLDQLTAVGARVLDAEAVRSVVATMGSDTFATAIGGTATDDLLIRADGAACLNEPEPPSCRRIVADGFNYRVFELSGEPLGTLTPARG